MRDLMLTMADRGSGKASGTLQAVRVRVALGDFILRLRLIGWRDTVKPLRHVRCCLVAVRRVKTRLAFSFRDVRQLSNGQRLTTQNGTKNSRKTCP
jgi:hypothetical protein